ncbi:MAG: hypothetical protein AAGA59_04100 [Actinomycetota bacterium]
MFGSAPRFPFRGLLLIGLGFLLASMIGGGATVGGVVSAVLFLPLLILKVMFFLVLFSLFFRLVGAFAGGGGRHRGHYGPWGHRRRGDGESDDRGDRWAGHGHRGRRGGQRRDGASTDPGYWSYRGRPMPGPTPPAPSRDDTEWEESLRQARREVDDLDAPYREPEATVAADPVDDLADRPADGGTGGSDGRPGDQADAGVDVDPGAEGPRD